MLKYSRIAYSLYLLCAACSFEASSSTLKSAHCDGDEGLDLVSHGRYQEGLRSWAAAARDGDAKAAFEFSVMSAWGIGFTATGSQADGAIENQAYTAAFFGALQECAQAGSTGAQLLLGTAILQGTYTSASSRAADLFGPAARKNDALAHLGLAALSHADRDSAAARNFASRALALTSEFDSYYVGFMYLNGRVLPRDYEEAAHWFAESAAANDWRGQGALAHLYTMGLGVPKDLEKAARLLALVRANPEAKVDEAPIIVEYSGTRPNK